jgi:3-deoxy-D-manno-octulosonate 8-phosphate phosphatase (KDO 8-P phosphatase)
MSELTPTPELRQMCHRIDTLLLDVDGVLTGGEIVYGDSGLELKAFHVRDGAALKLWTTLGRRAGVITGRTSPVVRVRAAELGLDPVVQGADDKFAVFRRLLAEDPSLTPETICYVGDDLPDLPVMRNCAFAAAPADACAEARQDAHYVTRACGGRGAVREVVELILRSQGAWDAVVERYRGERL